MFIFVVVRIWRFWVLFCLWCCDLVFGGLLFVWCFAGFGGFRLFADLLGLLRAVLWCFAGLRMVVWFGCGFCVLGGLVPFGVGLV